MLFKKYNLELYNKKSLVEIAISCQLRSRIYKFNKYLARISSIEVDIYRYGFKLKFLNYFLFRYSL